MASCTQLDKEPVRLGELSVGLREVAAQARESASLLRDHGFAAGCTGFGDELGSTLERSLHGRQPGRIRVLTQDRREGQVSIYREHESSVGLGEFDGLLC